jgi:hypothetical protein
MQAMFQEFMRKKGGQQKVEVVLSMNGREMSKLFRAEMKSKDANNRSQLRGG